MSRRTCKNEGCDEPVVGRRLCRAHYQQAWKAGEFVNEPLPPRQAGRTVCPDEHKHDGSATCYIQHQCRCVPCKTHHSAMEAGRRRAKAYGRFDTGLVDAGPVREHMLMLGEFGLGYKRIAGLAGVGVTAARNILWGRQEPGPRHGELPKRVKRENAERILAVRPDVDNLAMGAVIPARGTKRRVQALVARGWSQSKLCAMVGIERSNWGAMMQRDTVSVSTHRAVADLFDRLWNVEPPRVEWRDKIAYSRSVEFARQRRWLPPLAWDDIDTDVAPPVAEAEASGGIDESAVDLAVAGENIRLTHLERRAAVARLHAQRLSDRLIAERLHINARTALRIRQELGLAAFDQDELIFRDAA